MECTVCGRKAVYTYRYNGTSACREHFMEGFERRVRQEIRRQIRFRRPETRISVAISGGKDSSVTLYLLNKILGNRKDVILSAFTVDEGIEGYRGPGLQASINLCRSLGIRHDVKAYQQVFGTTMDRVVSEDPDTIPCARCGPMRRELINDLSMTQGGDYVALGLNLDDYAQSVLMNVVRGDLERMTRMAPHNVEKEGLVRRILPLRRIPEKEVVVYATLAGIQFDHSWCPYYGRAQRNTFREILQRLEEKSPGAKFGIIRFSDDLRSSLAVEVSKTGIGRCRFCGSPASGDVCAVCKQSGVNQ